MNFHPKLFWFTQFCRQNVANPFTHFCRWIHKCASFLGGGGLTQSWQCQDLHTLCYVIIQNTARALLMWKMINMYWHSISSWFCVFHIFRCLTHNLLPKNLSTGSKHWHKIQTRTDVCGDNLETPNIFIFGSQRVFCRFTPSLSHLALLLLLPWLHFNTLLKTSSKVFQLL